jgi:hypothetical protein
MAQHETFFRVTGNATECTITAHNAFPIHADLKARGYRFVTTDGAMAVWCLTLPRTAMAAVQAEAAWVKSTGLTIAR